MTLLNCSVDKERLERGIKIAVKKEPHSYLSEILNETVTYPSLLPSTKNLMPQVDTMTTNYRIRSAARTSFSSAKMEWRAIP